MQQKQSGKKIKRKFVAFNEKICYSKEISSIGTVGTVRLLKGRAAQILNSAGRYFAYASTRTYGSFLFSFGLLSLFLQFAEFYFKTEQGDAISNIIISAAVALIGVPLLIFDSPMCIALQDFPVTDYIFFEFLSIKKMHRSDRIKALPALGGLFLGCIPAVISFFIPIQYVLLVILLAVVAIVAFTTPEFPMILMILLLPYAALIPYSEILLVCMSALTFISYALKVVLGKRVYNLSLYDIIIFAGMLAVIVGGFFGKGGDSLKNAFIFTGLLLIYFPANNMIVNRRLADLAINAVVISSIPVSVLSIIEFAIESSGKGYTPPIFSTTGTAVFFSSPEALAGFLLVSSVLAVAYGIEKRHMWKKILYFGVFTLEIGVLGMTVQPFVWIAVALGIPAYFIITSKKIPTDTVILLILLPLALFALPSDVLDPVYAFLRISPSFSGMVAGYVEALNIFFDNIFLGVGIGEQSYNAASGSSSGGIFNTPIGIGVELGVFALVICIVLLILLLRRISYHRRFMTNSAFATVKDMSALAITALLIYGTGTYIFEDLSIVCLFFIVLGICGSVMRSARKDHDDRLSYYGDSRSNESSVIDIDLR